MKVFIGLQQVYTVSIIYIGYTWKNWSVVIILEIIFNLLFFEYAKSYNQNQINANDLQENIIYEWSHYIGSDQ